MAQSRAPGSIGLSIDGVGEIANEAAYFDRLYAECSPRVAGLVRKFFSDTDHVEDIVQETFLRAYGAGLHLEYAKPDPDHSPWHWLATVARNMCLDALRKHEAVLDLDAEDDTDEGAAWSLDDPELQLHAARQREGIRQALEAMCPRQRRLLLKKYVEGWAYRDIAREEGMTPDALKSTLARARQTFKSTYNSIARRGGFSSVLGGLGAALQTRMRAFRERVAGSAEAFSTAMAGAPAAMNTAATLAVLGVAGAATLLAPPIAGATVDEAHAPEPIVAEVAEPVAVSTSTPPEVVIDAEPVIEATAPVDAVVVADPPAAEVATPTHPADPPAPEPEAATPPTGAGLDTGDVVPVENPPAGGSASGGVSSGDEGARQHNEAELDLDGDGTGNVTNDAQTFVYCPGPDERGVVTMVACPVLEASEGEGS